MSEWVNFWTALGALGAGVSAVFAAIYTRLTWQMLQSAAAPEVVVYTHHDRSRPSILEIVIKNIGRGVACDIVFQLSRTIPQNAFGLTEAQAKPTTPMTEGPLIKGIPLLAPGESRHIVWGQFGGLYKALGDDYVTVICNYSYGSRAMQSVSRLEVRSFATTDASTSEGQKMIKALEKMADSTRNLARAADGILRLARKEAESHRVEAG